MLEQTHMKETSLRQTTFRVTARTFRLALLLALFACLLPATETLAQKNGAPTGRLEVSTNPGGNPILIDNVAAGTTTESVRIIELPPGPHTVEIVFPNGRRWNHVLNVIAGRKECIALNYRPRVIELVSAPVSPCPYPVNVSAPATVNDGDIVSFSADVTYSGASPLIYTWSVSPPTARITSGAGTPTITVDSTGLGRRRLTATLTVEDGSADPNCRQTSQSSTSILALTPTAVKPQRFDEFPSRAFDDDKARLDNFAIELQNNPGARGYIIAYAGRASRPGTADGLGTRAQTYLTRTRGIDASRFIIINGGYRESNGYELWLVPTGAEAPQPTPTISAGDVRPALRGGLRRPRQR